MNNIFKSIVATRLLSYAVDEVRTGNCGGCRNDFKSMEYHLVMEIVLLTFSFY